MIEKRMNNNKLNRLYFLFLMFLVLVFFIRVINLDGDPPPNGLMDYQPVDEGVYARLAIGTYSYGSVISFLKNGFQLLPETGQTIINVFGNALVYISLLIFGDNYYGLRIPSVLMMGGTFLLIYLMFRFLDSDSICSKKWKMFSRISTLSILVFNFQFYTASRITEPTVFRLFFVALILYIFLKLDKKVKSRGFLLGFVSTVSIFLVYINNTHLYISFFLYLIYLFFSGRKKEASLTLGTGILGIASALILIQMYYCLWGTDLISNSFDTVFSFQNNAAYSFIETESFFVVTFKHIVKFISSNMFIYCMPLLIVPLFNINYLLACFKQKNDKVVFLIFVILGLLLQTIVSEDFINRKSIVLLPAFTLLFYLCVLNGKQSFSMKSYVFSCVICLLVISAIVLYRYYFINDAYKFVNGKDGYIVFCCLILPMLIYSCSFWDWRLRRVIFVIAIFFNFLGNCFFIAKYDFKNIKFGEKEAMISLRKYNGEVILGEYVNGFNLYNDIETLLTTREETYKLMLTGEYKYYFDYDNVDAFLEYEFPDVTLEKDMIVERTLFNQMGDSNMCVYRIVLEDNR